MSETVTGGKKEFLFSVLWSVIILFIGKTVIQLLPAYKLAGGILTIIMFSVLGFFVLTRYAAIFTYSLKGYSLRINRMIGKRNKEIEFKVSDIRGISRKKPAVMPKRQYIYTMCSSVFSKKKRFYAEYTRNNVNEVLIFEPSEEMAKKIMELKKSSDKGVN